MASSAAVHSLFTRRALLVLALVVLVPTMMGTVVGACILCVLRGFGTFGATVYRHFLTGLAFNAEQLAKTFNDFEAAVLYGDTSAMMQPVNGNSEPPSSMANSTLHLVPHEPPLIPGPASLSTDDGISSVRLHDRLTGDCLGVSMLHLASARLGAIGLLKRAEVALV